MIWFQTTQFKGQKILQEGTSFVNPHMAGVIFGPNGMWPFLKAEKMRSLIMMVLKDISYLVSHEDSWSGGHFDRKNKRYVMMLTGHGTVKQTDQHPRKSRSEVHRD